MKNAQSPISGASTWLTFYVTHTYIHIYTYIYMCVYVYKVLATKRNSAKYEAAKVTKRS